MFYSLVTVWPTTVSSLLSCQICLCTKKATPWCGGEWYTVVLQKRSFIVWCPCLREESPSQKAHVSEWHTPNENNLLSPEQSLFLPFTWTAAKSWSGPGFIRDSPRPPGLWRGTWQPSLKGRDGVNCLVSCQEGVLHSDAGIHLVFLKNNNNKIYLSLFELFLFSRLYWATRWVNSSDLSSLLILSHALLFLPWSKFKGSSRQVKTLRNDHWQWIYRWSNRETSRSYDFHCSEGSPVPREGRTQPCPQSVSHTVSRLPSTLSEHA